MADRFVQARHYTPGRRGGIRLIVVHDMEAPEGATTAEAVASMWAGSRSPQSSAHLAVDTDSVVGCVRLQDTAWHAPGANADGIGIEHAGYARQSRGEWLDGPSRAVLDRSAVEAANLARFFGIPVRRLSIGEIADRHTKGFVGHIDVDNTFHQSNHWDPGPNFPWDVYLGMVSSHMAGPAPAPPIPAGEPHVNMSIPALLVKANSPESRFLRDYLSMATKNGPTGTPFSRYQIIEFDPAHPPQQVPAGSVGMGTQVPNWGQVAGRDRYDTLHQIVQYLGLPVC